VEIGLSAHALGGREVDTFMTAVRYKIPLSVLVVIHTPDLQVLMLERTDWPGFWQSVTGSVEREDEPLAQAAVREVGEETGIDAGSHHLADWHIENRFEIYKERLHLYAPGVTLNTEHVFGLRVPRCVPVTLEPREHTSYVWLPWGQAAQETISWSNRDAILLLPAKAGTA
jgi:dihydroneopterin triphosphate diphosphatase